MAKAWEEGAFQRDVPGSPKKKFWGQHKAHDAASRGDLELLIQIAKEDYHSLHVKDENGWEPIHEAVRSGSEPVIEFLHAQGVDLNSVVTSGDGDNSMSVLDLAIQKWGHDTKFITWLNSLGATHTLDPMLGSEL